MNSSKTKTVAVFRSDLLPRSETFIKEQVSALREWHPILCGYRRVENGLDLAGIDVRVIPGATAGWLKLGVLRCRQWTGWPHPPTVHVLREIGADLVHVHFGPDATDLWPSVRKAGLPLLVTLHGYDINIHRDWWESGKGGLRRRGYPARLLRMAADPAVHFVAVSNAIKARAIEYGIPEKKVVVAYIGVDTRRFRLGNVPIQQRSNRILFVGRMVEKKAPLLMVRAYAAVRESIPDAELVMIGDGPLLGDAKKLAADLFVPVSFLGARDSNSVLSELQTAKVFCLPSIVAENGDAEGFGLALLEAQACGLPVVSSAMGGSDEGIVDGSTGFRFPAGNMDQLVSRLCAVLSDPVMAARMAANAVAFVESRFDVIRLTGDLEQIYAQHVSSSR